MTQYQLSTTKTTTRKVTRKPIMMVCNLAYPDELAERIPFTKKCAFDSQHPLQFYMPPEIGDEVLHLGCVWEITGRLHHPYEPYSRATKFASELQLKYIREYAPPDELPPEIDIKSTDADTGKQD